MFYVDNCTTEPKFVDSERFLKVYRVFYLQSKSKKRSKLLKISVFLFACNLLLFFSSVLCHEFQEKRWILRARTCICIYILIVYTIL